MLLKRKPDEGSGADDEDTGRRLRLPQLEFNCNLMKEHYLERFIREVVRGGVEDAILKADSCNPQRGPRLHMNQENSTSRFQLHFRGKLPDTLYTGSKVATEEGKPLEIVIVETTSKETIRVGLLSSLKLEILVLDGDFGSDGQEEWTEADFYQNLVRERDGKKPLLAGKLLITLNSGIGNLTDVAFTDNSSWIRSRKFRLAAKVCQRCNFEVRIQEARSEPFMVKDHRGELNKKKHPPELDDEVWRLEKIGRDGPFHSRLMQGGVRTVRDFLRAYVMNQAKLRNLLGTISNKNWEAIVEHAKECPIGEKCYAYHIAQEHVLLFDSIFRLVGAKFNDIYHPFGGLIQYDKNVIEKMKQEAYLNHKEIVEFDGPAHSIIPRPLPSRSVAPSPAPKLLYSQLPNIISSHSDESVTQLGFCHQMGEISRQISFQNEIGSIEDFHQDQQHAPIRTNSYGIKDYLDPLGNVQVDICNAVYTRSATIPAQQMIAYNTGLNAITSNPILSGMNQFSSCETTVTHHVLQSSCSQVSSSNWVKLIAAFKWMLILKRVHEQRIPDMDATCQSLASDFYPNLWEGEW